MALLVLLSPAIAGREDPSDEPVIQVNSAIPIPLEIELNSAKAALGERLFKDKHLSADGKFACESCHYLDKGGTDNEVLSKAINNGKRNLNTPTIFNVGLLPSLTWTGNINDLGVLTEGMIKSEKGLATDLPTIAGKLAQDESYLKLFNKIYKEGISPENILDAMVEFMRSLYTPNSRFDKYLRGDKNAITRAERIGYQLFKSYGCVSCHQGVNLGGNMRAPSGIFGNFVIDRGDETNADLGLYNITKREEDKYVFRVPGLRNIALTGPYLHDGSAPKLRDAVETMALYMLGRELAPREIDLIVKFLNTLTGEYQGKPL
jgi:cytochrome c peroxidase